MLPRRRGRHLPSIREEGRFWSHSEGGRGNSIDVEDHRATFGRLEFASAKVPYPETRSDPGPKQRIDAVHGIT